MPQPTPCPTCADRRWVSTPTGRVRCACYWQILHEAIHPNLRHGEAVPPAAPGVAPWPLANQVVVGGEYHAFRHQAWRSLIYHLDADPNFRLQTRYLFIEAGRLMEIHFQRDTEFKSWMALQEPGLLILACGLTSSIEFGDKLVNKVLTTREMAGSPSWVYAATRHDLPQMAFPSMFARSALITPMTATTTVLPARTGDAILPPTHQGTPSKTVQLREAHAAAQRLKDES